jgi:hypothetical protein
MTDTSLTDLGPFFERYDRRNRLVFVAEISASLVLSAVIFARTQLLTGEPGPVLAYQRFFVVFPPVFIVAWQVFGELLARGRRKASQPDGRHPAGADDARNGMRIAKAGFAFNIIVMGSVIVQQAFMALSALGYPTGDAFARVTTVAVGVVTIYLGNLWPRMPTPRIPERTAALRMRANRFSGWLMVVVGALAVLLGLFLPLIYPLMGGHRP